MRQYFLRAAKRAETNPVVPNVVLSWSLIGRKACAQASFGGAMRGAIRAPSSWIVVRRADSMPWFGLGRLRYC